MEVELGLNSSDQSIFESDEDDRKVHGLLKSYHGIAYQLQWVMLVAIHSQKKGDDSGFKFKTEVEEADAGKFDDVVWKYQDSQKTKYNFLQCKHRLNVAEKITLNDLSKKGEKGVKNNPFSIQKYFISFITNIQKQKFLRNNAEIENLIIATNITFEESVKSSFDSIQVKNPVIKELQKKCNENLKCWKINKSNFPREIKTNLEETYDLIKLAKKIGEHIRDRTPFTLPNDLKPYYKSLYDTIVDCQLNRLSDNFISGTNLSRQAEYLRQAFVQEEFENRRAVFNIHNQEQKYIPNPEQIANILSELLKYCNDNIIRITRRLKAVRENIDILSGYILIEDDGIKFNSKFWIASDSDLPNDSVRKFKNVLLHKLKEYGLIKTEDSFSSVAQKFDSFRFDIKNFKTCRAELIDETSFWENVISYNKFQNYDFVISNTIGKERDLPNYSIGDIKNDINLFFDLLLYVTSCTKTHINSFLEKELNKKMEFIDSEYMAHAFRAEIAKVLDLTEKKFISNSIGVSQFINKIKTHINHYILSGPTIEYQIKTNLLGINFGKHSVNKLKLQHFILNSSKQILILNAINVKLSAVKVLQILKRIPKFQYHGAYIFMQIETILHLQEFVIEAFQNTSDLLVIESKNMPNMYDLKLEDFFESITKILNLKKHNKIIIITRENNALIQKIKENKQDLQWEEVFDRLNNVMNLSKPSREKLFEKTQFLFQGEKVNLNTFLADGFRHLIKDEMLFKIISNSDIRVGDTVADLGDIEKYYIPRIFRKSSFIKESVFNEDDTFAISNINQIELNQKLYKLNKKNSHIEIIPYDEKYLNDANKIKYFILDENDARIQFSSLCNKFPYKTIHWLNYDTEHFIWQNSQGPLDNVQKHIYPSKFQCEKKDDTFVEEIKLKKAVILSAEPGMGKSTIITKLASLLKMDIVVWILRVNLLYLSSDFRRSIDERFVIEFIYKAANFLFHNDNQQQQLNDIIKNTYMSEGKLIIKHKRSLKSSDLLEIQVFNYLFNTGKVVFFLDGFDEICSAHEGNVLKLIKILRGTRIANIFVTTRPYNIVQSLENLLSDFAYTLQPFQLSEQFDFLILYWKSNLRLHEIDTERAKVFIDELLCEFSQATNDSERDFVSIPLQLRMLADSFQITFFEFYNSTVHELNHLHKMKIKTKMDLLKLYKDFLKTKFETIRFQEKKPGCNPGDADMYQIKKREYKKFISDHRKLAVYTLFKDDTTTKTLTEIEEQQVKAKLLKNIEQANEKNGVVYGVVNGCPIFIHQSFAEYFASAYFWEKFKTSTVSEFTNNYLPNIMLKSLFSGKYIQTCRFFYLMARNDLQGKKEIPFAEKKVSYLLKSIVYNIKAIYDKYENGGTDNQTGTDELYYSQRFGNIFLNRDYIQCIRLLFKIIDHYLYNDKSEKSDMKEIIKEDPTINLLRMASEIGCLSFTRFFLQIGHWERDKYEKELKRKKWYFTPLWLSAKNNHLEIVSLLSNVYNPQWVDKDRLSLKQRLFCVNEFNVLNSCLISNILDGSPFIDLNQKLRLPLSKALAAQCPANIVRKLITMTDSNVVNEFVEDYGLSTPLSIICDFLSYDDDDTIELAISSGISFAGVLNLLLFEYSYNCLSDPVDSIRYAQIFKCTFFTESEFLNLVNLIKILLKSGVPFNTKCSRYNVFTIEFAESIHRIHTLLTILLDSDRMVDNITKLFIEKLPEVRIEVDCFDKKIELRYGTRSDSLNLIPANLRELLEKLSISDNTEYHLNKLQLYIDDAKEELILYKTYPDSKTYNNTLIGYEEMLEYKVNFKQKLALFKSLGNLERFLLERVLQYYTKQDYNILDAFKEVSNDTQKTVKLLSWIRSHENMKVSTDEVLELFDLSNIETSIEIQNLMAKIYEIKCIFFLTKCWENLSYVREKKITETIKLMTKYKNISSQVYLILNSLYIPYKKIISAVLTKDYSKINAILNEIDTCYIKSLINGQTEKYGSPLHYAVFIDDTRMVDFLLCKGADPNCKLDGLSIYGTDSIFDNDDNDSNDDYNYKGHSSLHVAVIKGNIDIISLLIEHGGDSVIKNDSGETSTQIARKNLTSNKDVYQKIIDILEKETKIRYRKLPDSRQCVMKQPLQVNSANIIESSIEIDTVDDCDIPSASSASARKRKAENDFE